MLWRANQDLRQFAHLTACDLQTPLATVTNLCEEVLDEFGSEMPLEARKLIQAARQRAFRMGELVDELLSTARPNDTSEEPENVSIAKILSEVIDRVRPTLIQRKIELVLPREFTTVWGNHVRIREAVYNVVSNAAKFIDKEPGRIEIRIELGATICTLSIADNGPGIPYSELGRIFVPFRRLPATHDQPGYGLGLYFAKHLIEEQGGRIWIDSEPGQGSCFHMELLRPPT